MATAPANNLPIFYNDLLPLSTMDHADYKSRSVDSAPFLTSQHAVPLTIDEFVTAQRFAPIIFSAGADSVPLLLMGLNEGVNIFLDDEGKLRGPAYVPAYVRRYPWMLAKLRPDSEELSLCFDPTSPALGAFEEGTPLFEDGKPSELTQGVLKFCEDFEQAAARTGQFVKELQDMDLLMDGEVSIQPEGAPQPVAGTVFDHRTPRTPDPGIDHNFCLSTERGTLRHACTLEAGGLRLEVSSTEPGLQVYAGAKIDGLIPIYIGMSVDAK